MKQIEKLALLDQAGERFGHVVCYIEKVAPDSPRTVRMPSVRIVRLPYDTNFDPPAIVLSVTVAGVVHRRPQVEASALIDTGADITAVPEAYVDKLKLYPIGRLNLEDASAVKTSLFTYE